MKYDYNAATGVATNPTIFADASAGLAFPNDIQFSPDGSKIYVANLSTGNVTRFNLDGSSAGLADHVAAGESSGVVDGVCLGMRALSRIIC